jgi:hypothetical protein
MSDIFQNLAKKSAAVFLLMFLPTKSYFQFLDETGVAADPNLTHRADPILTRGWLPTM